jgi:ABC-type transport system involved in cytochrome c biogenesis permease component
VNSPIAWKEWREQRWKTAFGTVMVLAFAGSIVSSRVMTAREAAGVIWIFCILLLPLYSAMGVFAPEHECGTLAFLASKPLRPARVFLAKWFFGWLNVMAPMLACAALALLLDRQRLHLPVDLWLAVCATSLATIYYTMTCCLAPRRASEAQVGFCGILLALGCFLHMIIIAHWTPHLGDDPSLARMILGGLNPLFAFKNMIQNYSDPTLSTVLAIEQCALFALLMWFGYRKWQRSL